jgi:hypothetical protein
VHDIAAFKFVTVVSSTVIGWVWQFTLQSAQRHNQISKIGDIFEKISTVNIFADLTISKRQKYLSRSLQKNFAYRNNVLTRENQKRKLKPYPVESTIENSVEG